MSLDDIRKHPKFQSLSPEDQEKVTRNFINREWSSYEKHPKFLSLTDQDKEKVRVGFINRFYGDALQPQPFVDAKEPNPLFEGLSPAGPVQSVHAPVKYPEDPESQGKIPRTWGEAAKDTAIDAANSVIGLGEAGVGIADMASFNLAGKGLSKVGYDPAKTKEILAQGYSDSRKQANKEVAEAQGFLGTVDALLDNPSVAFGAIVESSALTASGAALARYAAVRLLGSALAKNGIAAGSNAAKTFAAEFFANPTVQTKIVMAGAGAEGAQTAGLIQEQGRQEGKEWSKTILPATAAGLGTALIGGLTSKVPGLRDAEASLATAGLGGNFAAKQVLPTIAKGTVKEGLEETLQSYQENALTNVALGKPWLEGNAEAAGMGLVVGAGQGGAMVTGSSLLNLKKAVTADILTATNVDDAINKFQQGTGILQGANNAILQTPGNQDITEAEKTIDPQRATGLLSPRAAEDVLEPNVSGEPPLQQTEVESPLSIIPSENKLYKPITLPAVEPKPSQIEPIAEPIPKAEIVEPVEDQPVIEPNYPGTSQPIVSKDGTESVKPGDAGLPNVDIRIQESAEIKGGGQISPDEPTGKAADQSNVTDQASVRPETDGITLDSNPEQSPPDKVSTKQDITAQGTPPTTEATASAPSGGVVENPKSIANGQEVNTNPSEKQKEAENYKTAKVSVDGLNLSVENPVGSIRSGTDNNGRQWSIKMKNDYGRILGSKGYDKDHVDIFVAPGYKGNAETVYVVNQHNKDGSFDEHKSVIGVNSEKEALNLYNSNYEKGWTGGKSVIAMPIAEFKEWVVGDGPAKGELKPQAEKQTVKSIRQEIAELNRRIKNKPTPALKAELADAMGRLNRLKKVEYAAKVKQQSSKTPEQKQPVAPKEDDVSESSKPTEPTKAEPVVPQSDTLPSIKKVKVTKQTQPKETITTGSDTAKIQKIKQSRPHIDEIEFDTISAAVLSDNIKDIPLTRTARTVLSDMVSEGLASNELLGKFDSAKVKADFNEQARKLVKKRTDKELGNIDVADLELLEDLTAFVKEYGPKKVKDAISKEEKKLEELAKPKLISSHKNYTLSESVIGQPAWKLTKLAGGSTGLVPTDKIHIVAIDEADGPKKKKIEEVQRVVEAAVPRISEDVKAVRFILPDGTEYTVLNNKTALRSFKKLVSKIYTPVPTIRKGSTSVNQTNKAKKTFDWSEKTITHGEWVSDGTMAVRGFKPPNRPTEENSAFDTILVSYQQMAEKANPAEIRYYTSGETDKVVSREPVLKMGEFEPQTIVMDSITNKRVNVSQGKLNIVESVYPDVEYRISPDGVVFGYNEGEFVATIMPAKGEPMNEDMAKSYGLYSMGEFADTPVIMEMPELVELATELMKGKRPLLVDKFRKAGVKGQFVPSGSGNIKILKTLGADFHQALKTIAHEVGHLIDYKDADTMARGNILGRIASIKGYLKHYLEEKPGAPGVITDQDRKRLMKEARLLTKREASELIDEVITTETPVTPEQVLAVLKGMETDPEPTAEVVNFIFTASTAVKKSIGLQAMNGLSPEEMAHLKTYIEVKTGNQIEQQKPTNKDVYEKFKELVKKEIQKRNLISKEVITAELKLFTQLWKPFNVWGNAKYTKYRFSSEELYADALSGILVNPQMVQRVAPEFYKGFFNYIDNKPEASKTWEEIAKRIGRGPVEVSRARIKNDYEMFKRGEEVRAELAKGEESQGFIDTLAETLSDKHHFINKALKQSADKEKSKATINELKELPYIPSEVDAYLFEINKTIQKEMDDSNLTVHDLDVVALRKHIVANRQDIFSTGGYTPETAAKDLEILKADWGAEKYDKVNSLLDKLREIRDKRIYPLMEESGLYSEELAKFMNETTDYTKVSVTHHLNKKFGEGAGGRVYKALGTLSEVNSPVTATILQDISLIRAARVNKSKRSLIPLLQEVGGLKQAKVKYNGKFMVAAEPDSADERIFTVMINGNAENYYVSKHIVEAYEFDPYTANKVSDAWNFIASGTRQLFISKNPAWMAKNVTRDFFGTVTKNKEIGLRNMPALMLAYVKATSESFSEAWKRERSNTVDWLMTNRALTEDRVFDGRDVSIDTELHRLQSTYKLSTKADEEVGKFKKAWRGLNRNVDNFGRAMEIVSKIAGAKYLLDQGVSKQEVLNKVRNGLIGTPNFKERGKLHKYTNSIAMFSNVAVQGIKSHIEAAKDSPASYIWKTLALNAVPTMMMFLAAKGLFDDEEDDGTATGGGYIKRIMAGIPEYNMSHYTCIPLYLTKDKKSVWLQIPRDYEGQTFGAIAWKMMQGKFVGKGTVLSEAYNFWPYNIHPVPGSVLYVRDVYVKGINPVDDYMGRNKNSDAAMDVGGWKLAAEVGKNVWRDTGGGTLYKPEYDDIKRERSDAEVVLNLWGINAIGAYIQISDRGVSEKIFDKFRAIDLEKTKQNIAIDKTLSKMTQEEKMVVASIAPKLKDRITKQGLLAKNTALTRTLAAANSKEKLAIVFKEMAADMEKE